MYHQLPSALPSFLKIMMTMLFKREKKPQKNWDRRRSQF